MPSVYVSASDQELQKMPKCRDELYYAQIVLATQNHCIIYFVKLPCPLIFEDKGVQNLIIQEFTWKLFILTTVMCWLTVV